MWDRQDFRRRYGQSYADYSEGLAEDWQVSMAAATEQWHHAQQMSLAAGCRANEAGDGPGPRPQVAQEAMDRPMAAGEPGQPLHGEPCQ